jgi:purine-binding chemotaxis protein CheW
MTPLYLIAHVGGKRLAFRTSDIQSVVDLGKITPAPATPAFVAGLAALRSRPMTVIDCAVSLEIADQARQPVKGLIVEQDGYVYALSIDAVEDVVWIDDEVDHVPAKLHAGWRRVALGMVKVADEMLLLVDIKALIAGPLDQAA